HIGAEPDAPGARPLALEHADDAGAAEPAMHLDPPLRELVGDDAGGTHLLEADLGMGVHIPADGGEFVGKTCDASDVGQLCYPMAGEWERDLMEATKAGPFGLIRIPGRNFVQGRAAVSAGIAPGAAQIRSFAAIGSKSARKCTELLLTRIACSFGSMPT